MFELLQAGGWLMLPIVLSSIMATAIVGERFWSLRRQVVMPENLVGQIWQLDRRKLLNDDRIAEIREGSALDACWRRGWSIAFIPGKS